MKRVAKAEHDTIVEIPLIVGIRPVRIEPLLAVRVPLDVEDIRVAVGIGLRAAPSVPLPLEKSQG